MAVIHFAIVVPYRAYMARRGKSASEVPQGVTRPR
jgi:hypothetical protein